MKQHLVFLVTVIGLVALGAGVGGCGAWGKKETAPVAPQAVPSNSFARTWANNLKVDKNDPITELHVRQDTLFAYTKGHLVYGVDRIGGNTKYLAQPVITGGTLRPPLLLGQHVVYPSGSSLDILTDRGRPARTIELDKPIRSGAVGEGNFIYLGLDHYAGTGTVAKIDITKPYKVVVWELMADAAVSPTPALHNRVLYVGSEDGRIYAVTDERSQVWSLENKKGWFQTQGRFVSDIKADDTGIYASNTDMRLYCLDPQTGRIKWQYFASAPLKTAPVVTQTMAYQLVPGTGIVAIDKLTGEFHRKPKWIVKEARQVLSEDDQNVYLLRRDNRLMAVNKQSGQVAFLSKTKNLSVFATNTSDSTIYGATPEGHIEAIRPVLREGEVGNIVLDLRPEPLALAK